MRRASTQDVFVFRAHGGRRAGAGRKRMGSRPNVPHREREGHVARHPVHVTLRATTLPASLRDLFPVVRSALARASNTCFRVVAFSVQVDHMHLLVEADAPEALSRGVQGLAIRVAKALNRALGRHGAVWADRFHARDLASPRAVRHALVYILQNWRKHGRGGCGIDPCSSARWFEGWKNLAIAAATSSPTVTARTWLARWGWRRHGLIDVCEKPVRPAVRGRRGVPGP